MKKLFPFLLAAALILTLGCYRKQKAAEPKGFIVDFNKTVFVLAQGDSIWWQQPEFIEDSSWKSDSSGMVFSAGHSIPLEFRIGLKNIKPLVIIWNNKDTVRYILSGDTIRLYKCKPDTIYKPVYRNIEHVETLNQY